MCYILEYITVPDEDNIMYFSKSLTNTSKESILKTFSNRKYKNSWFNGDC